MIHIKLFFYKKLLFICFILSLISLQSCAQKANPTVKINNGYIKGIQEDDAFVFKGIPYAKPPIGPLRFKSPQPAVNWPDTLSCENFGNIAAQHGGNVNTPQGSEDCLTLNVYTPAKAIKSKLPVLVWVHGGGMTGGSGKSQNGHAFADQDSVVTVTINYRLGVFGFLYLGDTEKDYSSSGNNGLLDCIMALRWIKDNISQLGGDPSRVTVIGQSAGAKLISTLLLSPLAKGYFNQLILESGSVQCVRDSATAKGIRKRLLNTLNIEKPISLLSLSTAQIIAAQDKVCNGAQGTSYFGPVADGIVISGDPYTYLKKHPDPKIRLLIGTNTAESKMFMDADKRLYQPEENMLKDWFGNNYPYVLKGYQDTVKNSNEESIKTRVFTQYMYQMHAYRLINVLAGNGNPVWTYRFNYSKDNKGANHASELQYVWFLPHAHSYDDTEMQLGKEMHTAWVNFIKGKSPGKIGKNYWPLYKNNVPVIMKFDRSSAPVLLKDIYNDKSYPSSVFTLN